MQPNLTPPVKKFALLSVSDKTGIVEFARFLADNHYTILSTGGTAKTLRDSGIAVTEVSEYTGFPEMMDGRVKTLHPKIHGGLLARRDKNEHLAAAQQHGIGLIDMVVVNLYPFKQTIAKPNVTLEEAIENIDIGGPSMLRSAAKNHDSVTVVVDPADYAAVMREHHASITPGWCNEARHKTFLRQLAAKAFRHTHEYDGLIANYLDKVPA